MNGKKVIVQIGSINRKVSPGGISSYFESIIDFLNLDKQPVIGIEIGDKVGVVGKRIFFSSMQHSALLRMFMMRKLLRDIEKKFGEVVFVAHYLPNIFLCLHFLFRTETVFHFHGSAFLEAQIEGKNKYYVFMLKLLERLIYPRFKKIIVLSEFSKKLLIQHFGVCPDQITIIPYSVNGKLLNIPAILNAKITLKTDIFKITSVRRLYKRMGIINLLEAVKCLVQKGYPIELTIIGNGVLYQSFKDYIEQNNLQNNIFLLGKVSDKVLNEHLIASHLTVVPSVALEGFGIAIIESLQVGTPCLATQVGGIPEILQKIDANLIITENNADGISKKIKYYLDEPTKLPEPQMLLSNLNASFTYEANYPKLLSVYHG